MRHNELAHSGFTWCPFATVTTQGRVVHFIPGVLWPLYGFFGVGLVLYFASQGAGRLSWPVLGNLARLAVAALGGALVLRWGDGLTPIFIAQGVGLVIYALINVVAVAGGAWFGPIGWPRTVTLETSRATG